MFQTLLTAFSVIACSQTMVVGMRTNANVFLDHIMNNGATVMSNETKQQTEGHLNLSGYWRDSDNRIVYLYHNDNELIARQIVSSGEHDIEKSRVEFRATIVDNIAVGYLRRELAQEIHEACPGISSWVGIGLAINKNRSVLEGFRGFKTVLLEECEIETSKLVTISYTRVDSSEDRPIL